MKTSYYAITPDTTPGAICISRGMPRTSKYPRFWRLAPGKWFKSVSRQEYIKLYQEEILNQLDPQATWDKLHELVYPHEPILLCYEKPGDFCHRRLAAEWFEKNLRVSVPEARIISQQLSLF